MGRNIKKLIIFCALLASLFLSLQLAVAAEPSKSALQSVKLEDPLGGVTPGGLIGRVIKAVIGILGAITLFMFLLGGFWWLTSGGNAEKVKSGTQAMMWAAIGVAVVFSSYFIVQAWIGGLVGAK